jgi:hypothetical protein
MALRDVRGIQSTLVVTGKSATLLTTTGISKSKLRHVSINSLQSYSTQCSTQKPAVTTHVHASSCVVVTVNFSSKVYQRIHDFTPDRHFPHSTFPNRWNKQRTCFCGESIGSEAKDARSRTRLERRSSTRGDVPTGTGGIRFPTGDRGGRPYVREDRGEKTEDR